MKIERCPEGHFFDGDRYKTCPLCPSQEASAPEFRPTVGWLVCAEEPYRGLDFRLHVGYNYIGSSPRADISIPWDPQLGPEAGGILCYDEQLRLYSFGPRSKGLPVRVNGKMILDAVVLNPGDRLTAGSTALLFIPLCGPDFSWNSTRDERELRCTS